MSVSKLLEGPDTQFSPAPRARVHATGANSLAVATGDLGRASAEGRCSTARATGFGGRAKAIGRHALAMTTGRGGHASAPDEGGIAITMGPCSYASCGPKGAAHGLGGDCLVMGGLGATMTLHGWSDPAGRECTWTEIVGENGIEPGVWYRLDWYGDGFEPAEDEDSKEGA